MDFNFENLVSGVMGAVSRVGEAIYNLFKSDSNDSDSSSGSSDSEYIGDNCSNQVTDGAAVTYDYSGSSDSSSNGGDSSDSGDNSSDSSDSEYIGDNISCQVTDVAAVAIVGSVSDDGKSDIDDVEEYFEDKFKLLVGAFIGAEELQERSDQLTQDGYNQLADGTKDACEYLVSNYEKSLEIQQQANEMEQEGNDQLLAYAENEWNNISNYYQQVEENQEKTEEAIQEANYQLLDDAKNKCAELDGKHIMPSLGYAASASAGAREELSAQLVLDPAALDGDILATTGTGGSVAKPSVGGAWFGAITVADNGIPDLFEEGKNTGWTIGPVSVDIGTSEHATTYSVSFGPKGAKVYEAHMSDTYTYSATEELKKKADQLSEFGNGYIEYVKEKMTGQTDSQMTDEQKIEDAPYQMIDDTFGPNK